MKTIATSASFFLLLHCLGCGPGTTVQNTAQQLTTPSITQVLPQTIRAGSQTTTLKVTGTNFPAQAAILWNGAAVTTTVVDANTLSGTIGSNNLATPATVQLQVQNTQTMQSSQAVPVVIAAASTGSPSPLTISLTPLPQGVVSAPYTGTLTATGGTSPYTWSISNGQLPAGLSLAPATGIISGTPTASGNYSFGVAVVDSSASAQSATTTMAMSVVAAPSTPAPLIINSSSLPAGTIGTGYSTPLQASGGTAPYTWSFTSGNLPAGLSFNTSTGLISGTPTAIGTASFTVAVADSASPAQTKSVKLSLVVAAPAPATLTIGTTNLPSGTKSAAYSNALQASGGTTPYAWFITVGSLPAGLTLTPATGLISGTPTASGTASFTATVTDGGSPVQTKSVPLSIVVAAAAPSTLTISASLPAGTAGTAYSNPMTVTGGTPAYTWSISAGSLPAGLTLAATTGIISGTPSTSGTSNFTATVSDNSSPAQTNSVATSIVVAAAQQSSGPGTTWYVRPDGGTRYSANQTTGQCDGQADVAYSGTGTNQHCAFGDARWLWQDGSYSTAGNFPSWGWVIAGGDTVIIRGSIGSGVSWRVGWNSASSALDPNGLYYGLQGDPYNSGIPVPPSGTASQHTKILGENNAACTGQSARTQLHGGWGMYQVLDLTGASYVDLACLDITDFSDGVTLPDYARNGIKLSNTSTNDTLTDIRTHGLTSAGIFGPTGTGFVMTDIAVVGNGNSGWNADLGDGTTGVGTLLVQNYDISWNGCNEEYPIVDAVPYFYCRDQSTGGYGDGFGTASVDSAAPGWQITFTKGIASYNTQDGLDALHVGGAGSTMTVTNSLLFASEGQQVKAGGGAVATIQNNVIVGNCEGILQVVPGRPVPTQDSLGNVCRADNTAVLVNVIPGHPATYQFNTLFSSGAVGLEVEYATTSNGSGGGTTTDTGPTNTLLYNNNVFVGFYNSNNQANPTPVYSNSDLKMLTNPGASWTNNATFGGRSNWTCPAAGESNAICTDPGLVDETYHPFGYGNMAPASGSSAVVGAGVTVPGITVDYTGQTRANPPSIGAYEK